MGLLLILTVIAVGVSRPKGMADVVDVRHWSYPDYTRVVVELSKPVSTEVRYLPADRASKKADRLYQKADTLGESGLRSEACWVARDGGRV